MRAIIFDGAGDASVLRLTEVAEPELRPSDVLVRVHAAGVNRADIFQRRGNYGARPDYGDSLLPGLEVAGEVAAIGPGATGVRPGDRVMAVVGGGAYAEFARVDARMCMPVPAHLSYIEAAAIPEVFITAHEALVHLGGIEPGSWALIHAAAGGVGSAAVQLAHALGAKALFTASGEKAIELVIALGGTVGVDYKTADFVEAVKSATGGRGVDVVVDFIGGPYLERNLQALATGGRLIVVGALGGIKGELRFDLMIERRLRIIGTVMKSRSLADKVAMTRRFQERWLAAFDRGALRPLVETTFPLERAADAHRHLESAPRFGKVVLTLS
jgi:putative PIG3 family NAD(P)H quinone oxidoreductase